METEKAKMLHGIQTRIIVMGIIVEMLTMTLVFIVGIPLFKKEFSSSAKSTMKSTAEAYASEVELKVEENDNQMVGATELNELLEDVTVEGIEGSYCYLVSEDGLVLVHPTKEKIGEPVENEVIKDVVAKVKSGVDIETDAITYEYDGKTMFAGYSLVDNAKCILVVTAAERVALAPIYKYVTTMVTASIATLIIIIILTTLISQSIVKPIKLLTKVINKNSTFDFTESEESTVLAKGSGETSIMSRALEALRDNLTTIVIQLQGVSHSLKDNSSDLECIVTKLNSDSEDNSATSEELAASMEETSATTAVIDERIVAVNQNAQKISEYVASGEKAADEIIIKTTDLKKDTTAIGEKAERIYRSVKEDSDEAIQKAKGINKINELTEAITAIADQTSLLSLNASIEAARAGEAGRGFAIVASEISNLAAQSTNTAKDIATIVNSVKDAANSMEECLGKMTTFMEEEVMQDYQQFISISDEYNDDAQRFSNSMQKINEAIQNLSTGISDITSSVQGINSTIGEAAEGVTDVAAKSTDLVSLATDISDKANNNAELATQLDNVIQQFKI